jgi:eukaryotic-like serine/threonine-protein kinase
MTQARLLGGRYQVGELLGYGGMAEVHRGRDLRLGRDVAIKMLRTDLARDDTFQLRFRREAQNAASLNHPAIVAVYDTGEEHGATGETLPYIVMEFVNGRTLKEVLAGEGRLLPRRALDITAEICAALEFSHRHGIIHRDIKPGNVMLTQTGQVKVMDFGIARALASGAATMTQTSAVIGTAQYLSPEQARGESVDARSDVYATGCVLYELLCGQPPFVGDSPVSVAYQHVREDAKPPSQSNRDVSPAIDAVVLKALAKNPLNRYQSAAEMRADLLRAAAGRPVYAEPVLDAAAAGGATTVMQRTGQMTRPIGARVGDSRRRRTSGWAIAALTAIAVLAVVALTAGLIVLSQPEQATVPDVVGKSRTEADSLIRGASLNPVGKPVYNATCTLNQVSNQDVQPNARIDAGSNVGYEFCGGKRQIIVPAVLGLAKANAEKQIRDAGLVPESSEVDSAEREGTVVAMDPAAGAEVPEQQVVKLQISRGNLKAVPNVVGRSQEAAEGILDTAGFEVEVVPRPTTDPDEAGEVLGQEPAAGQERKVGDRVRIFVGQYDEPDPTDPPTESPSPGP